MRASIAVDAREAIQVSHDTRNKRLGPFGLGVAGLLLAAGQACSGSDAATNASAVDTAANSAASGGEGGGTDGARTSFEPRRPPIPRLVSASNRPAPDFTAIARLDRVAPPEGSMGDVREVFRKVAPGTVLVRAGDGMGSGVVVDASGLVLTNHHVVATAERDAFRLKVQVLFGRIDDHGNIVPEARAREGFVVKMDEREDMALIRVADMPSGVHVVPIASETPEPGEPVAALGNGNVGLVWAIRSCEIEAVGNFQERFSPLVGMRCTQTAANAAGDSAPAALCDRAREYYATNGGPTLVIQSSCPLSGGDSGGPLVNNDGELVGLNDFIRFNAERQSSSYHLHVDTIRAFLRDVPSEPLRALPDPWGRHDVVAVDDLDSNGVVDFLALRNPDSQSLTELVDLDGQPGPVRGLSLTQIVERKAFDAEFVNVAGDTVSYALYDSDNDGQFETVLAFRNSAVTEAYRLTSGSHLEPIPSLVGQRPWQAALVPAGAQRERFERLFRDDAADADRIPAAEPAYLATGSVADVDGDGRNDLLRSSSAIRSNIALAMDLDQSSLGEAGDSTDVQSLVASGRLDAEVSVVQRGAPWAFYDRDDDGRFDVALEGNASGIVQRAYSLGGSQPTPVSDQVGRWLFQPSLVGGRGASRFSSVVDGAGGEGWRAREDASIDGFPDPMRAHSMPTIRRLDHLEGLRNAVVSVESADFVSLLVDLDKDSFSGSRARLLRQPIDEVVTSGGFSGEFAILSGNGGVWAWYDTNNDGTWDTVLVAVETSSGNEYGAFVRDASGAFRAAPELVRPTLFRPALFSDARLRALFLSFAEQAFADDLIERP